MRKVLLVVGGARGIGASVAQLAARRGYDVAISYRERADRAHALARDLQASGARCFVLQADVRDAAQVRRLFEDTLTTLGAIDAVVIAAGVTGRASPLAEASPQLMQETIDINVVGSLLCAREAVRSMARSRGGHGGGIVFLSSGAATLGSAGEFVWYAASKGAIDSLTRGLAIEVAREGIRVNAVAPGLTLTELHGESTGEPGRAARLAPTVPLGRAATSDEIAEPILWLLSEAASYVTGTVVRAAGGR
ncbi:MAG: NAD(P)-dependent oxidoreductase [Myxococcaceae bacterium]|nr:NAD(P)-dependent oxidoreductase [Myxococcaceae bacterium]